MFFRLDDDVLMDEMSREAGHSLSTDQGRLEEYVILGGDGSEE